MADEKQDGKTADQPEITPEMEGELSAMGKGDPDKDKEA